MQVPALRKSLSAEVCAEIGELRAQVKTQHAGVGWRASGADPKHRCRCLFSSCVCAAHGFAEIPARYCRFSR